MAPGDVGLAFNWRFGPAERDIGHPAYVELQHTFRGVGLRPLSPVHVGGRRLGTGDLVLSWIRRTRIGGDSWEVNEVPLAEDTERYEVDILDGETVKRTLIATVPTITYSKDDQIADFGKLPAAITVRVYQMSNVWGRGTPTVAVV